MAEIAVVSARKARLSLKAAAGDPAYQAALDLANAPNRFLSTVQIGITTVGILAGAFGGATIAEELEIYFVQLGMLPSTSETLGVVIVVILTTYISLVLGELVPKQIGLIAPEKVAALVARTMNFTSKIAAPIVQLLSLSTTFVLRLTGLKPQPNDHITEEEIKLLIDQGTQQGVFEPIEDTIVDRVFSLGDQRIESLITPRTEIIWLDLDEPLHQTIQKLKAHNFSQFPVAQGNIDHLLGFVRSSDLLAQSLDLHEINLQSALLDPLFVPENSPVFSVLEKMRATSYEIAFVIDEFGGVSGLVNLRDLLEALVGNLPQAGELFDPDIVPQEDGAFLMNAMIPIQQFRQIFDLDVLPGEAENYYQSLGGFVLYLFGSIPKTGDRISWQHFCFKVVDMDGLRIDKLLISSQQSDYKKR